MNMQGLWKRLRRPEKVMHPVMWAESSRQNRDGRKYDR